MPSFWKRLFAPQPQLPPLPALEPGGEEVILCHLREPELQIAVIRIVRSATGKDLRESVQLVKSLPQSVGSYSDRSARELVRAFDAANATARLASGASVAPVGRDDGTAPTVVRRATTRAMRRTVWERDGGCCVECGSQFDLQYDHIIPISLGGAHTVENLQVLCSTCNQRKGNTIG